MVAQPPGPGFTWLGSGGDPIPAAHRRLPGLLGGIGLLSTLVALLPASHFAHGLSIDGTWSWIGATVVMWLVTAVATVVLPMLIPTKKADG